MKTIADVEYMGQVYRRAECVDGVWYFERPFGEIHPFALQLRVNVITERPSRPEDPAPPKAPRGPV